MHVGTVCSRSGDSGSMVYARQTRALARYHYGIVLPLSARSVVGGGLPRTVGCVCQEKKREILVESLESLRPLDSIPIVPPHTAPRAWAS